MSFYQSNRDYDLINEMSRKKIPNSFVSHRNCLRRLVTKFEETGSVLDAPRSARPCSAHTEENAMLVAQTYTKNPH